MKKKYLLIFSIIILCSVLTFLAKNIQQKYVKSMEINKSQPQQQENNSVGNSNLVDKEKGNTPAEVNTSEEKAKSEDKNIDNKNSNSTATSDNTKTTDKPIVKANSPNFFVIDTVSNKTLFSAYFNYNGENVQEVTKKLVGTNCVIRGGYLKEMYGLKERGAGPLSGWCYFVNDKKAVVGVASYAPDKNDIVVWKYLQDGLSN